MVCVQTYTNCFVVKNVLQIQYKLGYNVLPYEREKVNKNKNITKLS